jgi:hypothetical protein
VSDDAVFDADLTNPDVLRDGHISIERGEINIHRSRVLWDASCVERIRVTNFRWIALTSAGRSLRRRLRRRL